ncbi:DUF5642 family protein [Mycobacterium sp. 4D054]|uniref:DUF5642 family protein n=1 Tax=Mycobacterium sp. 4D054 TaxID=3457440 RepID=UPI003FD5A646
MRLFALFALALAGAACAAPPEPVPAPAPSPAVDHTVNPARIDRARDRLPEDYEVTAYTGPPSPFAVWGLSDTPTVDPGHCAVLGAPAVDPVTARGWSASGPGGIVYALVAGTADAAPAAPPDEGCSQWTVASGHTTGVVTGVPGPDIPAARTVGMSSAATTVVEGGTETRTHAETFVAYLGDHICFVAVLTDPGSPHPVLSRDFASGLLAETVSALRG